MGSDRVQILEAGPITLRLELVKEVDAEKLADLFEAIDPVALSNLTIVDRVSGGNPLVVPLISPQTWDLGDLARYTLADLLEYGGEGSEWSVKGFEHATATAVRAGITSEDQGKKRNSAFRELVDWSSSHLEHIREAYKAL